MQPVGSLATYLGRCWIGRLLAMARWPFAPTSLLLIAPGNIILWLRLKAQQVGRPF